jgi:uncharacterized protein YbcI
MIFFVRTIQNLMQSVNLEDAKEYLTRLISQFYTPLQTDINLNLSERYCILIFSNQSINQSMNQSINESMNE